MRLMRLRSLALVAVIALIMVGCTGKPPAKVVIVDHGQRIGVTGLPIVSGTVKNVGGLPASEVWVTVTWFGDDGYVPVGAGTTRVAGRLEAGRTATFNVIMIPTLKSETGPARYVPILTYQKRTR